MEYFGLILTIISFSIAILSLILYVVFTLVGKMELALLLEKVNLVLPVVVALVETIGLIIMKGENNLYLYNFNYDLSNVIFVLVPILIVLVLINFVIKGRRNSITGSKSIRFFNYLITPCTFVLFAIVTGILFFNIEYFSFLVA